MTTDKLAITGIMMGDTNAVTVLELAHRRQLINANVLSPETLLLPERPLPDGPDFGDVYIDDLVLFSMLHMSRLHDLQNCPRAARAEHTYRQLAMPISSDKGNTGFKAEFWGGAPEGISGSLGFPMHRRTTLMYVTLLGALLGVTRGSLQQILGAWNFALSFRREALCCLDVAFMCARKLPTRRHLRPPTVHSWMAYSWLLALLPSSKLTCVLNPATTCLRQMRARRALGRASPKWTPDLWHSLYRIAEERGEHVRPYDLTGVQRLLRQLSSPLTAPQPPSSPPRPGLSSSHIASAKNDHINVLELVALVSLIRRLSNQGARRQRILCCVDSRVVLGAVTKGRSSSRKLNHVFAKTCLRVPCFLAHRRPALGTVVGEPGRRTVAAFLSGPLAP